MNRHRLDELAERVAALEAAVARGRGAATLDSRLTAIEDALRRLRYDDEELKTMESVARRCAELVRRVVPEGERVAVASDGAASLPAPPDREVVPFPSGTHVGRGDGPFDHGAAAIAKVEAQRGGGTGFLLVPETVRGWLDRDRALTAHLFGRYAVLADEPETGLLVDLRARRAGASDAAGLAEVLDRVVAGDRYAPVLDWTRLDLASFVADRNVFAPPGGVDGELPYLDDTVDVVLVSDPAQLEEGRRVARAAVLVVSGDEAGRALVTHVEEMGEVRSAATDPIVLAVSTGDPEDPWLPRVEEAVAELPGATVVADPNPWARAAEAEGGAAVVVEPGVLPLPGCIEAAAATLLDHERIGAVAAKLFAADGSLEAAGATVFADGSVEGVGAGLDVDAPWHEFVRPVCAAAGLIAVRPSAARRVAAETSSLLEASAELWGAGFEVCYQPDAWAVRALEGDRPGPAGESTDGAWTSVLPRRPERPTPLDDVAWQWLLAHDDPSGCWR